MAPLPHLPITFTSNGIAPCRLLSGPTGPVSASPRAMDSFAGHYFHGPLPTTITHNIMGTRLRGHSALCTHRAETTFLLLDLPGQYTPQRRTNSACSAAGSFFSTHAVFIELKFDARYWLRTIWFAYRNNAFCLFLHQVSRILNLSITAGVRWIALTFDARRRRTGSTQRLWPIRALPDAPAFENLPAILGWVRRFGDASPPHHGATA